MDTSGILLTVVLFATCVVVFKATRGRKRDRLALAVRLVALGVLLNGMESHVPTDMTRFGYGFPRKWQFDPGYHHTGLRGHQHAVTPHAQWRFDGRALAFDAAAFLAAAAVAFAVNEVVRRSKGNRFTSSTSP